MAMCYVYVLLSLKDKKFYTGYTADLKRRLAEHNEGISESTRYRRPLELVYYEACRNQQDAMHRERYLKTTYGKRYIRSRLKHDLIENF
jgi:putative endonuclease